MKSKITLKLAILFGLIAVLYSCIAPDTRTVKQVMDDKVTELYKIKTPQELQSITNEQALSMFSEKDLNILSTRHWMFDTNVPVVVSVFRSKEQKVVDHRPKRSAAEPVSPDVSASVSGSLKPIPSLGVTSSPGSTNSTSTTTNLEVES